MENRHEMDWNGYTKIAFTVQGRESFIVCPKTTAPGAPWVWRCEFFGAFDTVDRALLARGWHLAYHRVSNMYGNPASIAMLHEFYTEATESFGLHRQPVLFGFSRGGLYAVHYALTYPSEVSALYLDAPVTNIASWPCGHPNAQREAEGCLNCYDLTWETLPDFRGNPNDRAEELAATRIPVVIVAGGVDTVVPWKDNGAILDARLRAAGAVVHTVVKPDCDHHPHSLEDSRPVTDFIAAHTDAAPALPNTLYRLTQDKQLTVAYFGGSITENGGENGWRGRNTAWLCERFPEAEITEIQAAIGGTGTSLGMFRLERDVLQHHPDLVYVEFAVNDYDNWRRTSVQMESILRRIRLQCPYTEIVMIFTLTKRIRDQLDAGEPYRSRDLQMQLARQYSIPTVDIGAALWRTIRQEYAGDWTPLAPDTVHPNDLGYRPCSAEMVSFMECALLGESHTLRAYPLPSPLHTALPMSARLEDATVAHTEGFALVEESLCHRYPRYIEGTAGASLTLEFYGETIGLYWMMAKDSGDIDYRIDGGEWQTTSSWDKYCPRFHRAGSRILAESLESRMHMLEIRVCDTHAPESEGTAIRIGAFLIA